MRLAFDLLNHPLDGVQLIEASAGTGKTWTLCALYLRLLLEKKTRCRTHSGRHLYQSGGRRAARTDSRAHPCFGARHRAQRKLRGPAGAPLACGRRAAMPAGAVAARTRTLSF